MSPNRKADLQRKLSLASIPKPPAGLADRIKSDIPHLLNDTEQQRQNLGRAVAFNMRVAASILLLVGSLFFALHLLNHAADEQQRNVAMFEKAVNTNTPPPPATSPTAMYRNRPQVVTSTEQPPSSVAPPRAPARPASVVADSGYIAMQDEKRRDKEEADSTKSKDDSPAGARAEEKVATGTAAGEPASPSFYSYSGRVEQPAAAAPRPAPATAPVAAPAPPPPSVAESVSVSTRKATSNLDLLRSAEAADLAIGAPARLFGYDLGTKSLAQVTPLVQHFTTPESRPRRGVRIEADAAPSPLDPSKFVLRISLDTQKTSGSADASPAPVAADARLEIELDPDAVTAHRAVTGEPVSPERVLVEGVSVTLLYELELKPSLGRHAHVATIRLHYRSLAEGRERDVKQEITFGNVAKSWNAGTLRTKQAALAAALGETRAHGGDLAPIVEKARAAGLTELAEMATKP